MSKDLERFSATLAYIENHLFEDIILKDLAKKHYYQNILSIAFLLI